MDWKGIVSENKRDRRKECNTRLGQERMDNRDRQNGRQETKGGRKRGKECRVRGRKRWGLKEGREEAGEAECTMKM